MKPCKYCKQTMPESHHRCKKVRERRNAEKRFCDIRCASKHWNESRRVKPKVVIPYDSFNFGRVV